MKKTLLFAAALLAAGLVSSQAADAKALWDKDCAKCHGMEGKADTKMGEKLGVRDLTDPKVQASFTDEKAFESIKNGLTKDGKKLMAPFAGKLSDEEIHSLVAHLRTFKKS